MSNIFIGLKKTCLGVLHRGEREKDNEICLKEGGGIKISSTVLHSRTTLSLKYLPNNFFNIFSNENFSTFSELILIILHPFLKCRPPLTK